MTRVRSWVLTIDLDAFCGGLVTDAHSKCISKWGGDDEQLCRAVRIARDGLFRLRKLIDPGLVVTSPTHGEVLRHLNGQVTRGVINVDAHTDDQVWRDSRCREACWADIARERGHQYWHCNPGSESYSAPHCWSLNDRRRYQHAKQERGAPAFLWPNLVVDKIGRRPVRVLHACSSPGYVPKEILYSLVEAFDHNWGTHLWGQTTNWLRHHGMGAREIREMSRDVFGCQASRRIEVLRWSHVGATNVFQ